MNDMNRIAEIVQRVARRLKVSAESINRGEDAQGRYVAIYVAKESGFDVPTICRYFEVSDATVYTGIKKVKERLENEVLLRVQVNGLVKNVDEAGMPETPASPADEAPAVAEKEKSAEDETPLEEQKDLRPAPVEATPEKAETKTIPTTSGPEPFASPGPLVSSDRLPSHNGSRKGAIRRRLEELGVLKQQVAKTWDDTPVVRVSRHELTIEVEDVGAITISGHVALGSLKTVAIQRIGRIVQAMRDGRFRIEEES